MEHISLYRKWRPQTFGEVIGQRHVTNTLSNALQSNRVVHAYLFCGPRGTGKTSTARILAKAINCVEGPTATPCNSCDACVSISEGTALDVIEIDAASNRKIDEIRELLEKIPYSPAALRSKVYIIDEVHQLTPEASSALLKTLEEPPGHVVFVLATTEPHKILPTIISRCQRFDFSLVHTQEISSLLEHISSREGIDIEPEAVGIIAEHARGSVRDAIGVMDQISTLSGERVTKGQLAEMLGEVEVELIFDMVDLIAERDTPGALSLVGKMVDSGKDPRRFVESLISHLRALFLLQNAANPREIVEATDEHFGRLEEQAGRLRRYEVVRLMERLGDTHREMRWSENPRIVLECAIVKATRVDVDISLEGLIFRLEELEKKVEGLEGGVPAVTTVKSDAAGRTERAKPPAVAKERAGKAKKAEVAEERAGTGDVPPVESEKVPAAGSMDREKARRAWVAVMAELKKQGQIRLYALLTKAKIRDAHEGEVVLAFPDDASFQLEVLEESGDLGRVEETWSRIAGGPVKLKLSSAAGRKAAKKGGTAGEPGKTGEAGGRAPNEGKVREQVPGAEEAGKGRPGSESRDLAELLKERFDGEIIEEKTRGKE